MNYIHIMIGHLDLQQLRMFFTLATTGSYTETARRLYRTQSAVSHAIRKLEASVGVRLVARKGADFKLTEDGQRLQKACETAFVAFENAVEDISKRQGSGLGRLRLGATVEFGCSILMKHMGPFLKDHPEIDFEFCMSNELVEPLMRDDLDVIIDCKEHHQTELDRAPLFREAYALVCSPEYQSRIPIDSIGDLDRATLLSLDVEGSWWQRFVFSIPPMDRPALAKIMSINHVRGMIVAAMNGIGVALVPTYSVLSALAAGQLVVLFPEFDLFEDRFSIYQKKYRKDLERHRLLTDYLRGIRPSEFGTIDKTAP